MHLRRTAVSTAAVAAAVVLLAPVSSGAFGPDVSAVEDVTAAAPTVEAPVAALRGARTRSMTTRWSTSTVERGERAHVRGRLAEPAPGRRVMLQQRVGKRWVVESRVVSRKGAFRLDLPTSTPGSYRLRLIAPVGPAHRSAGLRRAVSTAKRFVVLGPDSGSSSPQQKTTSRLLGDASDYTHITPGSARWNPCSTITYRVSPAFGPVHAVRDAKGAIARVARATGLKFRYLGTTKAVPQSTSGDEHPADTQIVIAWAGASRTPLITGKKVAGVGGPLGWGGTVDEDGNDVLTWRRGTVVLNTAYNGLPKGFGKGATSGKLLMHELGHVVGLGHAAGEAQVMYPTLQHEYPSAWQAGDTAGLRSQGAEQGCLYNRDGSEPGHARAATVGIVSEMSAGHELHLDGDR
jgi:hypothetical protein